MTSETRWAAAVRVLAMVSVLAVAVAVLEGLAVRRVRAELQQLRTERSDVQQGVAAAWAQQSRNEVTAALRQLDAFYADEIEGVGRPGGLCPEGRLDYSPVVQYGLGTFIAERAQGHSVDVAMEAMQDAVRETDAFKAKHPPAPQNAK